MFVDAGYLFAQGSTALAGAKKPRTEIRLNEAGVMAELTSAAESRSPGCRLLRVYWYDGAISPKLTFEHSTLAHMDYVKLRLGFVTGRGQQKGVDSLIVTDLIDLARNRAISDALVLSGDEDIRIGVQIAQSFGVRVHLIGIIPSRGSQSMQLLREADTTTEWDDTTVSKFLSLRAPTTTAAAVALAAVAISNPTGHPVTSSLDQTTASLLDIIATTIAATLNVDEVTSLKSFWATNRGIPREFDGKLLAYSRNQLHRNLETDEKHYVRLKFSSAVKAM
ncbi:MAG TPA: NYN domain-containing protein [Stellaceae bacterium]|jgi:hypothetical protein